MKIEYVCVRGSDKVELDFRRGYTEALGKELAIAYVILKFTGKELAITRVTLEFIGKELAITHVTLKFIGKELAITCVTLEFVGKELAITHASHSNCGECQWLFRGFLRSSSVS